MSRKKAFKNSVLALSMIAASSVYADGYYFGGNFAFLDYSEDIIDTSLNAIYGRLGSKFHENFSGEVRLGFGVGDDSVSIFGTSVDVGLKNILGAYVRGGTQVTEMFYPYAILGYTRAEIEFSASGFGSDSESETDVSYGLGADIDINEQITINIEYMNYFDKDGAEIDGFAIGVATTF